MEKKFLRRLGVFTLVVSFFTLISSGLQYFTLQVFSKQSDLQPLVLDLMKQQYGLSFSPEEIQAILIRHSSISAGLGFWGLILGIALLKRWVWGRQAFVLSLIVLTGWMILAAIFYPASKQGLLYWLGIVLSLTAALVHFWMARRLQAPEVRREFISS